MPVRPSQRTAWALCTAEAWGLASHGLLRLPYYLRRFESGGTDPTAALRPVSQTLAVAVFDGGNGLGHWQAWEAAEEAARRCQVAGISAVSVGNSGHCGCLGLYTLPMVRRGLIGLVVSNGPAVMPPWGGHRPVLSTSPIAAGIPTSPDPAIVDLATSAVARGRIAEHRARNEALPGGWAFDQAGVATTDPTEALAGMLAPLGGAKGYALAFLVEALTGGMVGPNLAGDIADPLDPARAGDPQRIAHLVISLDPHLLDVDGGMQRRLSLLVERIAGAGGRLPGSGRAAAEDPLDEAPLEVASQTAVQLAGEARRLGVALPEGWPAADPG